MFIIRMAVRETRASWRRLLFFFICIAVGVAAIVAMRSVIQSVRQVFGTEARSLIAADVLISTNRDWAPQTREAIDRRLREFGATQQTETIETPTMDASLHCVQGEAEGVTDLIPLLQEFYRDKLASVLRHQAAARFVTQYDANNAYQYIINREDTQLSWVGRAIVDLGGDVPATGAEPERKPSGKGTAAVNGLFQEDARDAATFVERWKPKVEGMAAAAACTASTASPRATPCFRLKESVTDGS